MTQKHVRITERIINRLKLRQLRLLIAVDRHRSILHAARELNLSQPAATKMIKDLEIDFDVPLFERTNRGVIPTVFGAALIRNGRLIFSQIAATAQELDDLADGSSGRIVVGTLLAASSRLLPLAIARVLRDRPKLAVRIVEGSNEILMPRLHAGELDMVVGRLPVLRHRSDLRQVRLFDDPIVVVAGPRHPLCAHPAPGFDALRPYGWVLPPPETTLRRQIDQFFVAQDQFVPVQSVESVSFLTNTGLLRETDMVCALPGQVAAAAVASGMLARLGVDLPFGNGPVGASFRANSSLSPAAEGFLAALQEVAAEAAPLQPISASDSQGQ